MPVWEWATQRKGNCIQGRWNLSIIIWALDPPFRGVGTGPVLWSLVHSGKRSLSSRDPIPCSLFHEGLFVFNYATQYWSLSFLITHCFRLWYETNEALFISKACVFGTQVLSFSPVCPPVLPTGLKLLLDQTVRMLLDPPLPPAMLLRSRLLVSPALSLGCLLIFLLSSPLL